VNRNTEIHQKYAAILQTLAHPLGPDTLSRIRNQLVAADEKGSAFIAVYSPETCTCFTATVVHGQVLGWSLFGAKDADTAQHGAEAMHAAVKEQLTPEVMAAAAAAAAVTAAAARRH